MKTTAAARAGYIAVALALLLLFGFWARSSHAGASQRGDLKIQFGPNGLERLTFAENDLTDLSKDPADAFHIWHMAATDLNGRKLTAGEYGWGETNSGKHWDEASHTWTYNFSWGSIRVQYLQTGDRLDVKVTEENKPGSGIVFEGATVYPLTLHLPERPTGFDGQFPRLTDNVQEPAIVMAEYGAATVAVALPGEQQPLFSGFEPVPKTAGQASENVYAVIAGGVKPDSMPQAVTRRPPLRPGQSDSYTLSIYFAPPGADPSVLAAETYRNWAARWPPTLNWSDRRIIGTVYLASSPSVETEFADLGANPRRYFIGQGAPVDVKSAAGLAAFQQRVLRQALSAAENLRRLNAQGVITWDLEGEEYPQDTSYVCSPDQIATVAPEMETVIQDAGSPFSGMRLDDAYFKILRDAGFRVGVCVRPQHFTKDARGHAMQARLPDAEAAAELIRKMRYAHDRWGATLFYLDSTVQADGQPLPPEVIEAAAAALPDSLLIPEESSLRMYRATAPFQSFLFHGDLATPPSVRLAYPAAFSANLVNDADSSKLAEHRDELTEAVRRGDVLMVHADSWNSNNDVVASIYREAAAEHKH